MIGEISQRFYRVFFVLMCVASGIGLLTLIYFNFWFNRLAAVTFLVDFSTFLLVGFLLLLVIRYTLLIVFAFLQHLERSHEPWHPAEYPLVTVIVPAYNEGILITAAVEPLMAMDYPRYEVLVIDDGSSDDTFERALELSRIYGPERLRVITQPNGGKAVALNTGIAAARGELILCMDGDSVLEPQTIREAVKHFADPGVGAVGGNVKVINRVNHLTRLQALEYIEGLSLVRTAHAFFRRVAVIPGPMAIDFGLSGPNLRGSGIDWDIRKAMPYSVYPEFEFEVPVGKGMFGTVGDCYDRYICRTREMGESSKIARQALDLIQQAPEGDIMAPKISRNLKVEAGETLSRVESARGEMAFYVVADGTNKAWRVRTRTGSFTAMGIIETISPGLMVADLVALIASLDVVAPEIDR